MREKSAGLDFRVSKYPTQARAIERIDAILTASRLLIAEKGFDAITMSDIAKKADSKLAAVYRYFPNKTAILKHLYEIQTEALNQRVLKMFEHVSTIDEVLASASQIFESYIEDNSQVMSYREIVQAVRANTELRELDLQNDRILSEQISLQLTEHLVSDAAVEVLRCNLLLILTGMGPLMRAIHFAPDDERTKLYDIMSDQLQTQLRTVLAKIWK